MEKTKKIFFLRFMNKMISKKIFGDISQVLSGFARVFEKLVNSK